MGAYPTGYANSDEKTWALIAHFGGALVLFVAPLVAVLVKGNRSATVRAHALQALNFQITWTVVLVFLEIIGACSGASALATICYLLELSTWGFIVVFCVLAGLKANEGQVFRYPLAVTLVN